LLGNGSLAAPTSSAQWSQGLDSYLGNDPSNAPFEIGEDHPFGLGFEGLVESTNLTSPFGDIDIGDMLTGEPIVDRDDMETRSSFAEEGEEGDENTEPDPKSPTPK
jgi:hypothetical protein